MSIATATQRLGNKPMTLGSTREGAGCAALTIRNSRHRAAIRIAHVRRIHMSPELVVQGCIHRSNVSVRSYWSRCGVTHLRRTFRVRSVAGRDFARWNDHAQHGHPGRSDRYRPRLRPRKMGRHHREHRATRPTRCTDSACSDSSNDTARPQRFLGAHGDQHRPTAFMKCRR
jgi:hypothetical protein